MLDHAERKKECTSQLPTEDSKIHNVYLFDSASTLLLMSSIGKNKILQNVIRYVSSSSQTGEWLRVKQFPCIAKCMSTLSMSQLQFESCLWAGPATQVQTGPPLRFGRDVVGEWEGAWHTARRKREGRDSGSRLGVSGRAK